MIWAGPERVFFGVGPPAVPKRMSRDAGVCAARGASSRAVD